MTIEKPSEIDTHRKNSTSFPKYIWLEYGIIADPGDDGDGDGDGDGGNNKPIEQLLENQLKGFRFETGNENDKLKFAHAIEYLESSLTGKLILDQARTMNIEIVFINNGNDAALPNGVIHWDPNAALTVTRAPNSETDLAKLVAQTDGVQSPALGLLHELAHLVFPNGLNSAYDHDFDTLGERIATEQENKVASELGEIQRFNHRGASLPTVDNPTTHTANDDTWVQRSWNGDDEFGGKFSDGSAPSVIDGFGLMWDCLWKFINNIFNSYNAGQSPNKVNEINLAASIVDSCPIDSATQAHPQFQITSPNQEIVIIGIDQFGTSLN